MVRIAPRNRLSSTLYCRLSKVNTLIAFGLVTLWAVAFVAHHMVVTTITTTTTTTTAQRAEHRILRQGSTKLYPLPIPPEQVWQELLEEGRTDRKDPGIVMEVGMHRAVQCVQAARAGYFAHCVEPSPRSFERVQSGVKRASKEVQDRIHIYNVAAGGSSSGTVPFKATGGTGDHVGEFDMWKMEAASETDSKKDVPSGKDSSIIHVPSTRLDDIIHDNGDSVYLLKVDTQGFEPTVFSGLTDSLRRNTVQYILFEYWPRGMDLLANKPNQCIAAQLLSLLASRGYTLYALNVQAHPKAPKGWKTIADQRPLDNFTENCRWYFSVEETFPSDEYKMGYWSDILAVAPGAPLPITPRTTVGRALQQQHADQTRPEAEVQ